jgi:hypothetical protein
VRLGMGSFDRKLHFDVMEGSIKNGNHDPIAVFGCEGRSYFFVMLCFS